MPSTVEGAQYNGRLSRHTVGAGGGAITKSTMEAIISTGGISAVIFTLIFTLGGLERLLKFFTVRRDFENVETCVRWCII